MGAYGVQCRSNLSIINPCAFNGVRRWCSTSCGRILILIGATSARWTTLGHRAKLVAPIDRFRALEVQTPFGAAMRIYTCSAPCKHVGAPETLRITVHLSRGQDYIKKPSLHRAPPVHGSPPGPGAKVDFFESRFRPKRLSDCKADASGCSEMHSFAFQAPCIAPSILAAWLREEREI